MKQSSGQVFSDIEFNTQYNDVLKSIIKTDSFYYIPGSQTDFFTIWYPGTSMKSRSFILKMDHSGNLLDTIYLDTIGYNRMIGNIIPQDSFFLVFYLTNPIDEKRKIGIGKYDKSFNELDYHIIDTIPSGYSRTDLQSKYILYDSTLYLYGLYYNYQGNYINIPFVINININTLQMNWFKVLGEDFAPVHLIIDTLSNENIIFDSEGYFYIYDSTFTNFSKDSLLYYNSMGPLPFEDRISCLPYQDSLFLIQAASLYFDGQYLWRGMILSVMDSSFNQKENHFYKMDSLQYVKTPINNGIVRSDDNGFFLAGFVCPRFTFYSNGVYVSKVDSSFNLIWERKIMNDSFPTVSDLIATDDGGVLILYSFISTEVNNTTKGSKLIKIGANGEITNIAEFKYPITQASLNIYPNPTSENLHINILGQQIGELNLKILDLQGRILLNKVINHPNENLDVSFLPSGTYILTATNSNGLSLSEKFVKY